MRQLASPLNRYLPFAYLGLALALAATLLPTALRPPPDTPPTSAALSPDAPPDDEQVLLSELGQGQSATAGVGTPTEVVESEGVPVPVAPPRRPTRGRCWGDPPRQAESIYSPPCVPAFTGNNGGATWRGVTGTEVRWGLLHARSGSGYEGPVANYPKDGGDDVVRSWRVWEEYFNKNFELYNRRLRLFIVRAGTDAWREGAQPRTAVHKLADEYDVMGYTQLDTSPPAFDESMRRGDLIYYGYGWGEPKNHDPMYWTFHAGGPRHIGTVAELVCKQLHGRTVSFAGDKSMHGQKRKLGMLEYRDPNLRMNYGDMFVEEIGRQCGWHVTSRRSFNWDDDPGGLTTAVTQFRADGVTTVFCLCDATLTPVTITHASTNQRYFPEWVHGGWLGIERNANAGLFDGEQWRNSIGVSSFEMNGARPSGQDWYRSYKEIDPDGEPITPSWESYPWHHVLHVAGAIQMAGPILTPDRIKEGLITRWPHRPPEPRWSTAGGYGPNDWNYSKYFQMMWWDPKAPRPQSTSQGAYRYLYEGQRFRQGELPTEPAPFFTEGITHPPEDEQL